MKKYIYAVISCGTLGSLLLTSLTSCETYAGQGAGYGAATGAIIGGATTGRVQGAAVGAAIGAATGALIGAAIAEEEAARYGRAPEGGYPWARPTDRRGFVISPYRPNRIIDVRGIPRGALVRDPSTGGIFRRP